jgi:hypothetical protein
MSRSEATWLFLMALGCGLCAAAVGWIVLRLLFGSPDTAPVDAFVGVLMLAPAARGSLLSRSVTFNRMRAVRSCGCACCDHWIALCFTRGGRGNPSPRRSC